jgi:hypothetical protein
MQRQEHLDSGKVCRQQVRIKRRYSERQRVHWRHKILPERR